MPRCNLAVLQRHWLEERPFKVQLAFKFSFILSRKTTVGSCHTWCVNHPQLMLVTCKKKCASKASRHDSVSLRRGASAEADLTPVTPRSPARQTDESTRVWPFRNAAGGATFPSWWMINAHDNLGQRARCELPCGLLIIGVINTMGTVRQKPGFSGLPGYFWDLPGPQFVNILLLIVKVWLRYYSRSWYIKLKSIKHPVILP